MEQDKGTAGEIRLDDIDRILRESVRPLTREERRAQMVSFAMGMLGTDSTVTREYVKKVLDETF